MAIRIFAAHTVGTKADGSPLQWIEGACDSDDTKPTGYATGSQFTEADTGDVYLYSEDDAAWNKAYSLGGGGGGGGGSDLPAVTADDNGDVLTVVEGAWAKAAPSGGGSDVLCITLTYDTTADDGSYTCDKTLVEINAALAIGIVVAQPVTDGSYGHPFIVSNVDGEANGGISFSLGVDGTGAYLQVMSWSVDADNVWSYLSGKTYLTV